MSTAVHTPCHSPTSSRDFLGFRNGLQDMHDSPFQYQHSPFQRVAATPPRMQPLLLSPSPVGRRTNDSIDFDSSMQLDFDDFSAATGISTPFRQSKKHALSPRPRPSEKEKDMPSFFRPPGPPLEGDDEGMFLRSHIGHISLPLRTPERVSYNDVRVPCSVANSNVPHVTKRKTKRLSSPKSRRNLTPIHIHHASQDGQSLKRFATLAPLPAPRFVRERKPVGSNVNKDVDILGEMRIADKVTDTDSDSDEGLSSLKVRRTMSRSRPSSGGSQVGGVSDSPHRHDDTRHPVSIPVPGEHVPRLASSRISHTRKSSNSSVKTAESLRRTSKTLEQSRPVCERRLASSATLFFGPAIVYPDAPGRAKKDDGSHSPSTPAKTEEITSASPDSSFTSTFPKLAETSVQFSFTLTSDPPSSPAKLPTKFKKSHDSGVALSEWEAGETSLPILGSSLDTKPDSQSRSHGRASTRSQPSASNTISTETTLFDGSFATPSHERSHDSDRPASPVDASLVDEFIVKTLEAGTKDGPAEKRPPGTPQKRTRIVFLGLPSRRPWATAAVEKMDRTPLLEDRLPAPNFSSIVDSGGSTVDLSDPKPTAMANNKGRKSCPGDLRSPMTTVAGLRSNGSTTDDAEISPTDVHLANPRNRNYGNVGLGRPSATFTASRFLSRSSSGFSTTSEGSEGGNAGTPTRYATSMQKGNDFRVPLLPFKQFLTPSPRPRNSTPPFLVSPSITKVETRGVGARLNGEYISNTSKHMKENKRPNVVENLPRTESKEKGSFLKSTDAVPLSSKKQGGVRKTTARATRPLGRFERDFVEVDNIGSGEFGSAIKVRFKREDKEGHVYAVKKSKRFEGNRHRLRLREEVEILQHLSASAGSEFHPNVLGYVDSWEQDDRLYILTELCEFGNFAHFLDEYGRHFQRLDEARVWKIFADISSGLRFIHMVNVVHFDLKPANIFITGVGRFKIGDFGMASFWPRLQRAGLASPANDLDFEREGDKMYLAAEVLQGLYGKEADIFSFGMMMLETATNIFLPAQGDSWHRLREQDFSQVEGFTQCSTSLRRLITSMMNKGPAMRPTAEKIYSNNVISRARALMEGLLANLQDQGEFQPDTLFRASPLAGVDDSFLSDILGEDVQSDAMEMDCAA